MLPAQQPVAHCVHVLAVVHGTPRWLPGETRQRALVEYEPGVIAFGVWRAPRIDESRYDWFSADDLADLGRDPDEIREMIRAARRGLGAFREWYGG